MSRYNRMTYTSMGFPRWTRGVKTLILACVITFVVQIIAGYGFTQTFGLTPAHVLYQGHIWQLVTYIFLHAPNNIMHILINMLGLWMFGSELEMLWGTRQFTKFFFVCGIGAGVLMVLLSMLTGVDNRPPTIGASGSLYGVLLAFAMIYPDRIIQWIIFPIPAKYFVMILGGIAFFSSISASGSGVAHVAHLGGMLCGYLYLKSRGAVGRRRGTWFGGLRTLFATWRRNRLRRKFDVYYNQRHSDEEKWRRWKN